MAKICEPCSLLCFAVLFVAVAWSPATAFGDMETQSFDTAESATAAGWAGYQNVDPDISDFGWRDSNNAEGTNGEAGGDMPWKEGEVRWYADTTIGSLDQSMPLHAEGKLVLAGGWTSNGQIHLGWFDQNDLDVPRDPWPPTYGIIPDSVSVGFLPERDYLPIEDMCAMPAFGPARGPWPRVQAVALEVAYDFILDYDPNGLAPGKGELLATFTEVAFPNDSTTVSSHDPAQNPDGSWSAWPQTIEPWNGELMNLNAFGLFTADDNNQTGVIGGPDIYVDDLSYTVGDDSPVIPPGDANTDGVVNDLDAEIVATNWGSTSATGPAQGDFNGDTHVNAADASIMAANWGYGTEAAGAVPEPGMIALIMGGLLGLLAGGARRASRQT